MHQRFTEHKHIHIMNPELGFLQRFKIAGTDLQSSSPDMQAKIFGLGWHAGVLALRHGRAAKLYQGPVIGDWGNVSMRAVSSDDR